MPTAVVVMMFLASAPLFLMPATIAWINRPRSVAIVVVNLVLWVFLYFEVSDPFNIPTSRFPFRPGAVGVLIAWMFLLRSAIKQKKSPATGSCDNQHNSRASPGQ
jgi:hypothetical protein